MREVGIFNVGYSKKGKEILTKRKKMKNAKETAQ